MDDERHEVVLEQLERAELLELPPERHYKVQFLSNPRLHWQKRSLHSLRCFAVELIAVVES